MKIYIVTAYQKMNKHLTVALCKKCRQWKPKTEYGKFSTGRRRYVCNGCYLSRKDAELKEHAELHARRERLLAGGQMDCTYCRKIKALDNFPIQCRGMYGSHHCKSCLAQKSRQRYYSRTVEQRRAVSRSAWASMMKDPVVKLRYVLRKRMTVALHRAMACKIESSARIIDYTGCSINELKSYLEAQFKPGMTWENHGTHGWHIDHVFPLCRFDLTKESDKRKAWHYTNLRPLWWRDNRAKNARILKQYQPRLLGITA